LSEEKSALDDFFSQRPPAAEMQAGSHPLGIVVGGSLSKGLNVKLDRNAVVEGMAVGRYVVVRGQTGRRFFSIITDVALDSTNPSPPGHQHLWPAGGLAHAGTGSGLR
jgi:hypothetical protein